MLYRYFKQGDQNVSLLGLGGMRFPLQDDGRVDEAETIRMIRHAIDNGINYVDTAYTYHGGLSEEIIGKALRDGYRQRTLIADKLPIWLVEKEEDVRRIFEEQRARLGLDCIDLYLVHSIEQEGWKITKKCNVLKTLEELRDEGKIGHIGFSFHDDYALFEEVIDAYPWEFCQIQLNYVDVDFQAGVKGLKYAASKGIPVVIMEPLKGGRITDAVPPIVQAVWDRAKATDQPGLPTTDQATETGANAEAAGSGCSTRDPQGSGSIKAHTPAQWAFKWVASFPEVMTILSGMSSMEQLDENLKTFSDEDLPHLSKEESALIEEVAALYRKLIKYPCTECRYCMPCPSGVLIPRVIRYYNDWCAFEQNPKLKEEYMIWLDEKEHASSCVKCGQCEKACPQHLPVMQIMDEIVQAFGC